MAPDSRRIVQARRQAVPVPEPLVQRIIARTDGNPFFLEKLAGTVGAQEARALLEALGA